MTKDQINHDLAIAIAQIHLRDYITERNKSHEMKPLTIEQECQYIKSEYNNIIDIFSKS